VHSVQGESLLNVTSLSSNYLPAAKSHSASQEIPRLLSKPKSYYRDLNKAPLVPILSQVNSVTNLPSCVSKIHFNIILPFTPMYLRIFDNYK